MGGRRETGRRVFVLALAGLVASLAASPGSADDFTNVRLGNSSERFAVSVALATAAGRLDHPECQALLDEFTDASGRPLRASLEASGLGPSAYLGRGVFFYDAPESLCAASNLAITKPGSRAILVCGARFARQMKRSSRHAEAVLIHEALHSLGLGENPPSSDYITDRVLARCGEDGRPVGKGTTRAVARR